MAIGRSFGAAIVAATAAATGGAAAETLATCQSPSGYSYYHAGGSVRADASGWESAAMEAGTFSLTRSGAGAADILFSGAGGGLHAATSGGATVTLLQDGATVLSALVVYPGTTTELYTFQADENGQLTMTLLQQRTGPTYYSSSMMVGLCDFIRFSG